MNSNCVNPILKRILNLAKLARLFNKSLRFLIVFFHDPIFEYVYAEFRRDQSRQK